MENPGWNAIEDAISQAISGSSDPFDCATVANAKDLIDSCRKSCTVPEGAAKGYWSTIRIWWGNLEVEVFDDHYEFYRFEQGHTDIQHFTHAPGEGVPMGLMQHLPIRGEQA